MIPTLLLLVHLTWTVSSVDSAGLAIGTQIPVQLECEVARERKSPTAVRLGNTLYANPDSFATYWPTVAREADTTFVARAWSAPGAFVSVVVDTTGGPWAWFVLCRKPSGRWSALVPGSWAIR
jgi:hypothetical protein